jgi:hypothetical protein
MVTINNKNPILETYSEPKLDISLFKKKSNANTFKGFLLGKMKETRKAGNRDLTEAIQFIYKKYLEYLKLEKEFNNELPGMEIVGGWKGKGTIDINQRLFSKDVLVKIPIKDKKTLKVKWSKKVIPKENVNRILCYVNKWKIGDQHECYEFAEVLGEINWQEVWKKRTKVYFLKYYYPIKILESMGLIEYGGRGEITKIREFKDE